LLVFVGKSRHSGIYAQSATPKPTSCLEDDGTWAAQHNKCDDYGGDGWAGYEYDGSWTGYNEYGGSERSWAGNNDGAWAAQHNRCNDYDGGGWAGYGSWAGYNDYDGSEHGGDRSWADNNDYGAGAGQHNWGNDYGGGDVAGYDSWAGYKEYGGGEHGYAGSWADNNYDVAGAGKHNKRKKWPMQPAYPPPQELVPQAKRQKTRLAPTAKAHVRANQAARKPSPKARPVTKPKAEAKTEASQFNKDALLALKRGVSDYWEDLYGEFSSEWISQGGNEPPGEAAASDDQHEATSTASDDQQEATSSTAKPVTIKRARGTKHRAGKKIQFKRFTQLLEEVIKNN
jgi:hypothetical protein